MYGAILMMAALGPKKKTFMPSKRLFWSKMTLLVPQDIGVWPLSLMSRKGFGRKVGSQYVGMKTIHPTYSNANAKHSIVN